MPDIFTEVARFVDWVRDTIKANSSDWVLEETMGISDWKHSSQQLYKVLHEEHVVSRDKNTTGLYSERPENKKKSWSVVNGRKEFLWEQLCLLVFYWVPETKR